MSQQQQNETRPAAPPKGGASDQAGQKGGQDAQQRRNAHSNSASAGQDAQHSTSKNLETEPDRAGQTDRNDERSRVGK